MERLTFKEQIKFYIQWCRDNNVAPKDIRSLNTYIQEITKEIK